MNVAKLIENVDVKNKDSVKAAVLEAIGSEIKIGDKVAVIGEQPDPYVGTHGKVTEMLNNGYAKVEFGNNQSFPIHLNLLVKV